MAEPSIFTKIIRGEIPCHKVYENDAVLAFLDIHPIRAGHLLVVPKTEVDHFNDLSDQEYHAVFAAVKLLSKRQEAVLGVKRACLRVEGFDVPHAHVHVIPCNVAEDFHNPDRMNHEPDHPALAEMAERLRLS